MAENLPLCKCGCGQQVRTMNHVYIFGHTGKDMRIQALCAAGRVRANARRKALAAKLMQTAKDAKAEQLAVPKTVAMTVTTEMSYAKVLELANQYLNNGCDIDVVKELAAKQLQKTSGMGFTQVVQNVLPKPKRQYRKKLEQHFKRWTAEQDEFIRKNYIPPSAGTFKQRSKAIRFLRRSLKRTAHAVGCRITTLGLAKTAPAVS